MKKKLPRLLHVHVPEFVTLSLSLFSSLEVGGRIVLFVLSIVRQAEQRSRVAAASRWGQLLVSAECSNSI